jgi:drug/metabolite transporter (DMT)-like permease
MNDVSQWQSTVQNKLRSASTGFKLIVICILALLMTVPAVFVKGLVSERLQNRREVIRDISSYVGGEQTLLGPTLAIPYTIAPRSVTETTRQWVISFGLISCAGVVPLALIAGAVRGIPLPWRLIDCSFGVSGSIPLFICTHLVRKLEHEGTCPG